MEKNKEENLNDSWVELDGRSSASRSPVLMRPESAALDKLLLEAQKESCSTSHAESPPSSKASSNGVNTGSAQAEVESLPELKETDWVWDWSSRPEIVPPCDAAPRPRQTASQRYRLSIRNTWIMRGLLYPLENLPLLILSHACSFILGATTMFIFMKKYGGSASNSALSTMSFL